MEFVPEDPSLFRLAIHALKEFLPQAQMHISANGVRIRGMDSSHVCFVDYYLAKADCKSLKVDGDDIVIGVSTTILSQILAAIGITPASSSDIHLVCRIQDTKELQDKLLISYTNEKQAKNGEFEIQLLDISEDSIGLPDITYSGTLRTNTTDICTAVKEVSFFGDSIGMRLDENGFHISASGDYGKVKQTLEPTDKRVMELSNDGVEALYSTRYIVQIMKGGSVLSDSMQFDFDEEYPLRASFQFGKASYYNAYLAPKIVDE